MWDATREEEEEEEDNIVCSEEEESEAEEARTPYDTRTHTRSARMLVPPSQLALARRRGREPEHFVHAVNRSAGRKMYSLMPPQRNHGEDMHITLCTPKRSKRMPLFQELGGMAMSAPKTRNPQAPIITYVGTPERSRYAKPGMLSLSPHPLPRHLVF